MLKFANVEWSQHHLCLNSCHVVLLTRNRSSCRDTDLWKLKKLKTLATLNLHIMKSISSYGWQKEFPREARTIYYPFSEYWSIKLWSEQGRFVLDFMMNDTSVSHIRDLFKQFHSAHLIINTIYWSGDFLIMIRVTITFVTSHTIDVFRKMMCLPYS